MDCIEAATTKGDVEMGFRSIETLASDMLRKIEAGDFPLWEETEEPGTERSAVKRARPSGPSQQPRGAAASSRMKNAEAEAPASADREEIVKQGKKSAVNLRVVSDNRRCLDTASRRRSKPHAPVVSRHLRLVWSANHATVSGAR